MPTEDFALTIKNYLSSDPSVDAKNRPIDIGNPLLGVRDGAPPMSGIDFRPYTGIARGGIWTREPKPYDPADRRGATPTAFDAEEGGLIRPCIWVTEESQINHYQFQRITQATDVGILVWYYAPSHNNGNIALEEMDRRVCKLLDDYHFTTNRGFGAQARWSFHYGARDNHRQFPGSRVAFTRFYITTLRDEEL